MVLFRTGVTVPINTRVVVSNIGASFRVSLAIVGGMSSNPWAWGRKDKLTSFRGGTSSWSCLSGWVLPQYLLCLKLRDAPVFEALLSVLLQNCAKDTKTTPDRRCFRYPTISFCCQNYEDKKIQIVQILLSHFCHLRVRCNSAEDAVLDSCLLL